MTNSDMIGYMGILITVVVGVAAFFVVTKRNSVKIIQKTRDGNANMNNNTIANEINSKKESK